MIIRRVLALSLALCLKAAAQTEAPHPPEASHPPEVPRTAPKADDRMKADVLLIVAHPDDETGVSAYLAQLLDQGKRVAAVYLTHGEAGHNNMGRERANSLGAVREMELRHAMTQLGIQNVWFLEGKDTPSQDVLQSLGNWGHGANLEDVVRMVRLTRPEIILTWLPGIFIGENHGDHQASGVLATEAFDLANDATAFPAQVAGAAKRLEIYLENLTPWQPKKLYFFSDADDQKQFAGTGPAYSIREISPSQKKPYWRLAMDAATPHLTQFPEDIQRLLKMSEDELNKMMGDPKAGWWPEPMTLIFGKSAVATERTADVFAQAHSQENPPAGMAGSKGTSIPYAELAGPWSYYQEFRRRHGELPEAKMPEIGVKAGSTLTVPLVVTHSPNQEVEVTVTAPDGWQVMNGAGRLRLPAENKTALNVEIVTP